MSKSKTSKTEEFAGEAIETNVTKLPSFDAPKFEVPELMRELAEKSVTQAKETYENVKTAAEEATDMMEDTYETVRKGFVNYNLKLIDNAQANADRTFAFAKELVGAKSFSDAIELQTKFVREQFETFATQTKDLQELGVKLASESTVPMKEAWERTAGKLKVA